MTATDGLVTLLTDFGTRDPFVGVMKGVLLSVERRLGFPFGTVHVVVMDPGVGSERAGVVVHAHEHYF